MRAVYRQWIQQDVKRSAAESYSPLSLILMFFFFSFIGWCWEVGYHLVIDHRFINRGMLFGPWLPIYGVGGVMILLVLRHFFERPGKLFFMIMLVCGTIEYLTGWALETVWHTRWWDYREYTFQIQGRVSLIGLLVFGTGGLAIVYWIAPRFNQWLEKKKAEERKSLHVYCFCCFLWMSVIPCCIRTREQGSQLRRGQCWRCDRSFPGMHTHELLILVSIIP